jgi:hypothetical protein
MPLTKDKKINIPKLPKKTIIPVESNAMRRFREMNEASAKAANDAKDKILFEKNEKIRIRKIILPYLDSLYEQLEKKDLFSFWTFPDRKGFKKIHHTGYFDLQYMIDENPDMYKNRTIVEVNMRTYHDESVGSSYEELGVMLGISIGIFYIDKHGVFNGDNNSYGLDFTWHYEDFKITKFSFKLLEKIIQLVVARKVYGVALIGMQLEEVIERLKKVKVSLNDVLSPLAGV